VFIGFALDVDDLYAVVDVESPEREALRTDRAAVRVAHFGLAVLRMNEVSRKGR